MSAVVDEKVLSSPEIRLRLIDLGYKDLTEEEMKAEIRRIYLEENGVELPYDIEIFKSSESELVSGGGSAYDGVAVNFHSEEGMNETYVISEGTQGMDDWKYNIKAMFAGRSHEQAEATKDFVIDVKNEFGLTDSSEIIGLSHSLAHNNNTTAHLLYDTFDSIYSVNGAQTNYYQLYYADPHFNSVVTEEFDLSPTNPEAIYDLDPSELEAFALNYYKEESAGVHQLISSDDPLYAASATRGFFTLGEVDMVDTNPEFGGLRHLVEQIPEEAIKDFQELAVTYAEATEKGNSDFVIKEMTGIDMAIVDEIDGLGSLAWTYVTEADSINQMIESANEKIPLLLDRVEVVTENADSIFGALEKSGYMTAEQRKEVVQIFTQIQADLETIEESISGMHQVRSLGFPQAILGGDIAGGLMIKDAVDSLFLQLEKLNTSDFHHILEVIGHSHSIAEMLSGLSSNRKSYLGTDMVLTTHTGGKEIKVNITASLRMYHEGKSLLEDKSDMIRRFEQAADEEIYDCYEQEKNRVLTKVHDIEQNPVSYTHLLRKHVFYTRASKVVRGIQVHESFSPLRNADLNNEVHQLNGSVEKGYVYLEKYRKAIEDLFSKDDYVATLFKLSNEIYS